MNGSEMRHAGWREPGAGIAGILFKSALAVGLSIGFPSPGRAADPGPLTVELNKLEAVNKSCRAYILVNNPSDTAFQTFKLDLIFFRTDGVIDRRFAFDLGPLRPDKRSVKSFDVDGLSCDGVGSILVNDVLECRDAAGPVADCLGRLTVSSRAAATFSK